jgi:hypothetical protein
MRRYELADEQWELVCELFRPEQGNGRSLRSHRSMVNAMLWILNAGSPSRGRAPVDARGEPLPPVWTPTAITAINLVDTGDATSSLLADLASDKPLRLRNANRKRKLRLAEKDDLALMRVRWAKPKTKGRSIVTRVQSAPLGRNFGRTAQHLGTVELRAE